MISADFGTHDSDECKSEFSRLSAESIVKSGSAALSSLDSRLKSKLRQKDQLMVDLSKLDAPTSNITAFEKIKSDQSKSKLSLNVSAIKGSCNPKTLVNLMKALNSYFDQLAGSYPLIRIFSTYINTEFLANNVSVAFPMESNGYSLGDPIEKGFQDVLSRFIEIESRSLARILLSISTDLVEDVCTMQAIKSS
eukprot:SAG31_NODE_2430_length_5708_cov_2.891246_1_plen_193_part_10